MARIEMFERGEPCPDVTDTATTAYYPSYGTADGKERQRAIDDALQEIDELLAGKPQ